MTDYLSVGLATWDVGTTWRMYRSGDRETTYDRCSYSAECVIGRRTTGKMIIGQYTQTSADVRLAGITDTITIRKYLTYAQKLTSLVYRKWHKQKIKEKSN